VISGRGQRAGENCRGKTPRSREYGKALLSGFGHPGLPQETNFDRRPGPDPGPSNSTVLPAGPAPAGLKPGAGTVPDGRWRAYTYDELAARDKASLDIFWLKDDSLSDSDNLPPPEVIAQEIVDDLEAALEQFRLIAGDLNTRSEGEAA